MVDLTLLKQQVLQSIGEQSVKGLNQVNSRQGHGYAAEEMNHLLDKVMMKNAILTGNDLDPKTGRFVKHGHDRIVDGKFIQTKYCKSGRLCVESCVSGGDLIYKLENGRPQQIEVPSDKYEEALLNLENRIRKGSIKSIKDPNEAKNIIRKGAFSYDQAKRVTQAGTIESLIFDSASGMIIASEVLLISGVLTFANAIWSGKNSDEALDIAIDVSIKVAGVAFLTHVISAQLSKTFIKGAFKTSANAIIQSDSIKPLLNGISRKVIGNSTEITNNLSSQGVAAIATIVVLSSIELKKFLNSKISGAQAFKSITVLSVGVAAGIVGNAVGKIAGAKIGASLGSNGGPYGALIGAAVGSLVASYLAGMATKSILDNFIEDDSVAMLRIFEEAIGDLAQDYLLGTLEIESVVSKVYENKDMAEFLCFMFYAEKKSQCAYSVAYVIAEKEVNEVLTERSVITINSKKIESICDNKITSQILEA